MMTDLYAPRCEIRISGTTLAADISSQVIGVTYENSLDLADAFTIDVRNADNRLLDSALFDLGKSVEIHLGYGATLEPMIWGEITSLETVFPENGAPTLRISGYDKSYRLRHNQPRRTFRYHNASLIAAQIAIEAGLIPMVDPVPARPEAEHRQQESDFALLKALAEPYFMDVFVRWDRLYFQFPRPTSALALEWGRNLSSFTPSITTEGQTGIQVIRGYNQELAQSIVAFALAADFNPDNLLERLGSAGLDLLTSIGRQVIEKKPVSSPLDAANLARSVLQTLLEGMYEASGSCVGNPLLRAGGYVAIEGVGKRFRGTYRLRKVTHTLNDSGYRTDFEISQRSHASLLSLLRKHVGHDDSPDDTRSYPGVYVGEVVEDTELAGTPTATPAIGRVRVKIPQLGDDYTTGWAPCVMPMTGSDMGTFFLPRHGDQVLVTFAQGKLTQPFVLGSLWNATQLPPVTRTPGGVSDQRVIKSKAGHTITFEDGQEAKLIVQDQKGSRITLDSTTSTITISAAGDLTISAKGNITIQAGDAADKNVTIKASLVDIPAS